MKHKHDAKRNAAAAKTAANLAEAKPTHEDKNSRIDSELKSTAGNVQEELTPIRRSAGHAHTH